MCREEEDVEMVGKGGVLHARQRKNGQRGRREPGVAVVMEAKEERVSRKKGWCVTMRPIQKVGRSVSRVDRFSRAGETGKLLASETLWLESACFAQCFKNKTSKLCPGLKNQVISDKNVSRFQLSFKKKSEDSPWLGAEETGPEGTVTPLNGPDSQHLVSLGSVATVGQMEGSPAPGGGLAVERRRN